MPHRSGYSRLQSIGRSPAADTVSEPDLAAVMEKLKLYGLESLSGRERLLLGLNPDTSFGRILSQEPVQEGLLPGEDPNAPVGTEFQAVDPGSMPSPAPTQNLGPEIPQPAPVQSMDLSALDQAERQQRRLFEDLDAEIESGKRAKAIKDASSSMQKLAELLNGSSGSSTA